MVFILYIIFWCMNETYIYHIYYIRFLYIFPFQYLYINNLVLRYINIVRQILSYIRRTLYVKHGHTYDVDCTSNTVVLTIIIININVKVTFLDSTHNFINRRTIEKQQLHKCNIELLQENQHEFQC